jgi:hypothetical protein
MSTNTIRLHRIIRASREKIYRAFLDAMRRPNGFRRTDLPARCVFLAILWVLNAVFVIIASIQASDGKFYRYPITIRFIQ